MGEMSSEGSQLSAGIDLSQFYQVFFEEAGENLDRMEKRAPTFLPPLARRPAFWIYRPAAQPLIAREPSESH